MSEAEDRTSPNGPPPDPGLSPAPHRPGRKRAAWLLLFLVMAVLSGCYWLASFAYAPAPTREPTLVLIPKGAGAGEISTILRERRLLADDLRFLLLAGLTGKADRLQAGEYSIPARATPLAILRLLEEGRVVVKTVTIREGLNIEKIAAILAREGWVDAQRFIALARDPEFIQTLGIDQESLEGYLFPDTYRLTRGDVSEEALLRMMTRRFQRIWREVTAGNPSAMSRHDVVTLASIVEKETGAAQERPQIARVFLNRLARNMRLQSDPTVIYGLEEFDGDLTRRHLRLKTPYNTYVIKGLPPGPICNPGREAIEAVLEPADNPYLFFVSKNDGTHHFSITLKEHNRAVNKYQRKKVPKEKEKVAVAEQPTMPAATEQTADKQEAPETGQVLVPARVTEEAPAPEAVSMAEAEEKQDAERLPGQEQLQESEQGQEKHPNQEPVPEPI